MNKLFLAAVALAAALSMGSCGSSDKAAGEQADSIATEQAATDNAGVTTLADDALYRPDKAPAKLTLLDFNATWCGPCKQFGPTFEAAAAKYAGKADFVSVDVDVCPQTAEAFGISSIPCVKVLRPDGTVETYQGTDELLPESKFFAIVDAGLK